MEDPLHIIPLLFSILCIVVIISIAALLRHFTEWLASKHPALPWFVYVIVPLVFILVFFRSFLPNLDWRTISLVVLCLVFSFGSLVLLCFACTVLDKRKTAPSWLKTLALVYVVAFFPVLFTFILIADFFSR